jgi:hypothetical protein
MKTNNYDGENKIMKTVFKCFFGIFSYFLLINSFGTSSTGAISRYYQS